MAVKNEMIRRKQNYKVNNWPEYNLSLKKRGSLEVWISDEIEELWYEKDTINDGTGKPKKYTEKSIELSYSLKLAFKQPLRQAEGFVNSIFKMAGLEAKCPDYSTLSRRCATLDLKIPKYKKGEVEREAGKERVITLDSTGLKQYGKDEWHQEKHKVKPRRSWKKLHIVVDDSNMIQGVELTEKSVHDSTVVPDLLDQVEGQGDRYIADGAYDTKEVYEEVARQNQNAKIVINPRENAATSDEWSPERNKTLDIIDKHGYKGWYKIRKYGFQNYAELSIQRYKKIIGAKMHSRDLLRQKNEAIIATSILNKFTTLGMPNSKKAA
jgi:hypothetical protein